MWRRCVCVLFSFHSLIDRAREATRDRAKHSNIRARSTARCVVAAVAVVVACVVAACVCVCVYVCVVFVLCCFFPRSSP